MFGGVVKSTFLNARRNTTINRENNAKANIVLIKYQ